MIPKQDVAVIICWGRFRRKRGPLTWTTSVSVGLCGTVVVLGREEKIS